MASLEQIVALPNGARFYRADLHIHSYGGSYDVKDVTMTPDGIVQAAIAEGLEVISITDHQEISNVEAAMKAAAGKNLLVIPGIELSTPQGHLLCYLPTYEALQTFYGRLNLIKEKRSSHCQDGMTACMDHLSSLGGFAILAHVDGDGGFELALPGGASPHRKDVICHEALAGIELLSLASNISY